jgi:hypothetical protein
VFVFLEQDFCLQCWSLLLWFYYRQSPFSKKWFYYRHVLCLPNLTHSIAYIFILQMPRRTSGLLLKTLLKMPSHPASHHPYNQHLVSEKSWLRGGPMLYTTVYNLSEKISLWYPLFIWFFDLYTKRSILIGMTRWPKTTYWVALDEIHICLLHWSIFSAFLVP